MNYMLPILSVTIFAAVTLPTAAGQSLQDVGGKEVANGGAAGTPASTNAAAQTAPSGQKLVKEAMQRTLLARGIEAKSRQRVNIFDQQLVGSGTYLQLTQGPKLLLKLDLKLQVDGDSSSLRQISDGDSLWVIQRHNAATHVSRVNMRRLREAAAKVQPAALPPSLWMALGGIPRLLSQLADHFQFHKPQPLTINGLPVWKVEGQWKPEILAKLLPDQEADILAGRGARLDELPEHLPHGVTLILGRDQIIPLFPYSFSFYRDVKVEGEEQTRRVPLVTWELFEVRIRPDLQPSEFEFRPTDQQIEERTEEYLTRLKEAAKAAMTKQR